MTTNTDIRTREPWIAELAEQLRTEFDGILPAEVVTTTALGAKHDLSGQIAPEAQNEMVYRLARYRLDQLSSDSEPG